MPTTEELIDTLSKGDMVQAGQAFTDLMNAKVQDSLNDRKVELGQQMHLSPEEIEAMNAEAEPDEDELEDEDETEEESEEESEEEAEEEEVEEDEDIRPDSTES
jgi:Skp family chaperone for outer membrane proteins